MDRHRAANHALHLNAGDAVFAMRQPADYSKTGSQAGLRLKTTPARRGAAPRQRMRTLLPPTTAVRRWPR